jgi:hypothetical protein
MVYVSDYGTYRYGDIRSPYSGSLQIQLHNNDIRNLKGPPPYPNPADKNHKKWIHTVPVGEER